MKIGTPLLRCAKSMQVHQETNRHAVLAMRQKGNTIDLFHIVKIDAPPLRCIEKIAKSIFFIKKNGLAALAMRQKRSNIDRFSYCKNRRPAFALHRRNRTNHDFHQETNRHAAVAMRQKGSNVDLFSYCKNRRPAFAMHRKNRKINILHKEKWTRRLGNASERKQHRSFFIL